MKRISFAVAAFLFFGGRSAVAADDVDLVVSGSPAGTVMSYRAEGAVYLDAKGVGRGYGAQVYWYPVSGRVQLTLRGRTVQFVVDSTDASAGDEHFTLLSPVIARASRAFIPASLLTSEPFQRWSGFDAQFDPDKGVLRVDRRTNVGPVRVFTYKERTRVTVDLAGDLSPTAAARGRGSVEISVPAGSVDASQRVSVADGVVESYTMKQDPHGAKITVKLATTDGQKWSAFETDNPHRVCIDIYAPGVAAADQPPPPGNGESAPSPAPAIPNRATKERVAPAALSSKNSVPIPPPAESVSADGDPEPAVATPPAEVHKPRRIVVDPGHGGKDPGATGARGTQEKDVNLAVAKELVRVLRARGEFEVVLTRQDDTFIPLSDRSDKANSIDADLFVSLHCNSARRRSEKGFEVYSVSETASDPEAEQLAETENASLELEGKNPQDETAKLILLAMTKTEMINESAPFAALVEREIAKRIDVSDRGVKQAGFYVLRGTHAPAILVEMAFVSNAGEETKLGTTRFRRRIAEGIAAGIAEYAKKKGWLE